MSATMEENTRIAAEAEIARLNAETARLQTETARLQAETARIQAETRTLNGSFGIMGFQADKLLSETRKLDKESKWFTAQVLGGLLGGALAIFAAAAGFLKFLDWWKP